MKSNMKKSLLAIMLMGVIVSSCGDSSKTPENKPQKGGVIEVQIQQVLKENADKFSTYFSYFSFKENKQLDLKNEAAKTSSAWDIAFLGGNGRTNGGESGAGKGEVYLVETTDFDGVKSAEEYVTDAANWVKDKEIENVMLLQTDKKGTVMPPPSYTTSFNPLFIATRWLDIKMNQMPPIMTSRNFVYIVRLANGNEYVKLQFIDISGTKDSGRRLGDVRFRYAFIPLKGDANTAKKLGEMTYDKTTPLSETLKPEEAAEIKYLTVKGTTLKQADFDFMKAKMPKLVELNLTDAVLDVDYNDNFLKDNKTIKKVLMPKKLEFIGKGWLGYSNIEEVVLAPGSVKRLGSGAFAFAQKLKKVTLPATLESMEESTFHACVALEEIEIPEKVILIPTSCFNTCLKMKKIFLKGKVRTLGEDAFASCSALTELKFGHAVPPTYEASPFDRVNWDKLKIHVPKGSVSEYIKAWTGFKPEHSKYFVEY